MLPRFGSEENEIRNTSVSGCYVAFFCGLFLFLATPIGGLFCHKWISHMFVTPPILLPSATLKDLLLDMRPDRPESS